MVYPLLPVLARGVGVELTTIAVVLTVSQLMGLAAPLTGAISERRGRRVTIMIGLLFNALGMLAVFVSPNLMGLAIALWAAALGKIAFDPAVLAYVGDRVPYQRRGLVMGIMEIGWSGAYVIGVPLMTFLIAQYDWRAPFGVIAFLCGVGFVVAWFMLEDDKPEKTKQQISFFSSLRSAVNTPAAWAGLALGFGISAANQLVSVVFGIWIEASFGIALTALAAAAIAIGLSEVVGEGAVAGFADRLGKRRLITIGVIINIVACGILPFTDFSLNAALFGLFVFYLGFEISLVATLPLATEISPHARGMYMTILVTAFTVSRALVTPLAPILFEYGLLVNCIVAVVLNAMALVAALVFIRVE